MVKTVKNIAEIIINDPEFVDDVKTSIDKILKDGKIDLADIPEMMSLVTLGYNKSSNFTVTLEELPELLSEIAHLLISKYDLVPEENREKFEKVLQSSISLILLMPKVKSVCVSCFPCFGN